MNTSSWWSDLQSRIQSYDLLTHPYYVAWSMGELTRQEIADYAADYYHHVKAFPDYLQELENRLPDGSLKDSICQNRLEEKGHSDLWLNFAEGMGADREAVKKGVPSESMASLMDSFMQTARTGSVPEALTKFYVYESQVPRIAGEKGHWLAEKYGCDNKTLYYFTLHQTADERHAEVWHQLIEGELSAHPDKAVTALEAGETAAKKLWGALDGIDANRQGARPMAWLAFRLRGRGQLFASCDFEEFRSPLA
jgi:pyrroloquinoline-quinone synthase